MKGMDIQGIPIESTMNVERETDLLEVKNKLQFRVAESLGFWKRDDDPMFEEFIDRYGRALSEMLNAHQEILMAYQKYLKEGSEKEFDITEIKNLLPKYLPKVH